MYTTIVRQYEVNGTLKTYAYQYEGDEKTGTQIAEGRCEAGIEGWAEENLHSVRLSEIQAVCGRIAAHLDVPLF